MTINSRPAGNGLSNYAIKLALRRRADGGAQNPMPRPFHWNYHPKHECVENQGNIDVRKLLPCENIYKIMPFRVQHFY